MSIASRITSIEGHIEEDYNALERLGADLTNVDKNIENIASVVNDIYDKLPKVTGTGSDLSLTPTLKGALGILPLGNAEQDGTPTPDNPIDVKVVTGDNQVVVQNKNLCDIVLDENISSTILYKTYTLKPNTNYTVSTNTFITEPYDIANVFAVSGTTITPSTVNNGVNGNKVITSDSNGNITIAYRNESNKLDYSSGDYYIQIELGSTATSYVAHQEQSYTLHLGTKNYFGGFTFSKTSSNVDFSYETTGIITANGIASANASSMSLSEGGTYNVSLNVGTYYIKGGLTSDKKLIVLDTSGTQLANDIGLGATFTLNETTNVFIRCYITSGQVCNNDKFKVIISKTNGSFTPYGTTPLELCKIGDYQDVITGTKDNWKVVRNIGKVVLNGTESCLYISVPQGSLFRYDNIIDAINDKLYIPLSNYYKGIPSQNYQYRQNNQFYINVITEHIYLDFIDNRYTELEAYQNWLETNNVTCYYVLAESIEEDIADTTLIEELNNLADALSYDGTTNITITSDSNNAQMLAQVSALKGE